jgi:hypothetical protein
MIKLPFIIFMKIKLMPAVFLASRFYSEELASQIIQTCMQTPVSGAK